MSRLKGKNKITARFFATGLVLGLALIGGAYILRHATPAVAAWFDENFMYRKAVNVTNSSGGALTDFQVSLSIGSSAAIVAGKMQSDCDDIRITDANGQLLPHWVETGDYGCNQVADTRIWTKVPSLPTSGATVYIYYGNPTASSTSSGQAVFEFFDDFSASSVDPNKWNTSGSPTISAGSLVLSNSSSISSKLGITGADGLGQMIVRAKQAVVNLSGGKIGFSSTNTLASDFHAADSLSLNFGNTEEKLTDFGGANKVAHLKLEETSLASGDPIDDASTNDADLQVVTGATSATGKINNGLTFNGSTQYLKQQVIDDATGASFGPTVHGLSLDPDSAFMRVQGVDLSPYASAGNDYMMVVSDGEGDKAWGYIDTADGVEALGSDLFDAGAGTFDSGTYSWVASGSNTIENDAGSLKITYVDNAYGAMIYFRDTYDLSTNLTIGKLYKLTFDAKVNAGSSVSIVVNGGNADVSGSRTITETNFVSKTIYFAASSATNADIYTYGDMAAGEIIWLDNLILKEVTDVGIDGVHIMSTKGGSTQSWAGISASFNYNASAYTFEVRETEFQITGAVSIGAWINPSSLPSSGNQALIFQKRTNDAGYAGFRLGLYNSAGTQQIYTVTNTSARQTTYTIPTSSWTYIAFTNNGSNAYLYINGAQIDTWAESVPNDSYYPLQLGALANPMGTASSFFAGTIDEPFVISSALTEDQVKALYEYYTISTSASATKSTPVNTASGTNDTSYHIYTLTSQAALSSLIQDSTTLATSSTNLPAVAQYARLQNSDATNALSVDWIAVIKPATATPTTTLATEEVGGGPVAYWSFDDGQGSIAQDKSANNNDGTLGTGSSAPTWQSEDMCVSGKCLKFDNIDDVVSVTNSISDIKTVSFWVKPNTTTEYFIDLNGSAYISAAAGAVSATGFTTPIYYVNGRAMTSPTLTANQWNYITVTTTSGLTGSAIKLGKISTNHLQGFLDDIKIYPYARTAAQIKLDYNSRGTTKGTSANLSGNNSAIQPFNNSLSNGLVGYWNMDTGSGTTAPDLSGNGNTGTFGTGSSAPTWANAKFGNGLLFGDNDYVSITNSSSLAFDNQISVSAWINLSTTSAWKTIVHGTQTGGWGTSYWLATFNNTIRWSINSDSSNDLTYTFTTDTWHHVIATYDGIKARIFIDGKLEKEFSKTGTIDNEDGVKIGQVGYGDLTYGLRGLADEVRIYNRALSGAEVRALYNFAPGPKVYLKADEGVGSSAFDSSGNSNNGLLNGALWKTGKFGKGVWLDGTDDNVGVSDFGY